MSASSMKQIKNRIKSIESTMQITKAMELVASSKMRRVLDRIEKSAPYFKILRETLTDIERDNYDFSSVFTREREGRVCRIVIAGDRGLAGGYNHNLFKSLELGADDIILPIGRKVIERFPDYDIYTDAYVKAADVKLSDCYAMGRAIAASYKKGEFASLYISYTGFKNVLLQEPVTVKILPLRLDREDSGEKRRGHELTLYEPDAETAFDEIVPNYISGMIYGAVAESVASEISARRNAMRSANDNASEMLDKLRLQYNQARQSSITQELTEVVAGAENPV